MNRMVKKRKTDMEPNEDSSFFQSFVEAANSVSHMYTQAVKEQRAAAHTGSRQTLERIAHWMNMQGTSDAISKCALRELLHDEHLKSGGGGLYSRPQRVPQHSMDEVFAESMEPALHMTRSPWAQSNQTHVDAPFQASEDAQPFSTYFQGSRESENMQHVQQVNNPFPQFGIPGQYNHQFHNRGQGPSHGV